MINGNTLRLNITQQFARIGLEHQKTKLELRQPMAQMELKQTAPSMQMEGGRGQLIIDGSEARAALGHRPPVETVLHICAQVRGIVNEVIGDIAAEGDQLMRIERKTTIGNIAHQRWNIGPMPIQDVGPFSYTPVRIDYVPKETEITWDVHPNADIQVQPQPIDLQVTPGYVKPYIAQQNWLEIGTTGKHLNIEF